MGRYGGDEGSSLLQVGNMQEKIDLLLSTVNQAVSRIE